MTTYFELNSTFRNRNIYPTVSEFVVPISESGTNITNITKDGDTVSLFSPIGDLFTSSIDALNDINADVLTIQIINPFILVIEGTGSLFSTPIDFYKGTIVSISNGVTSQSHIISKSRTFTPNRVEITLTTPLQVQAPNDIQFSVIDSVSPTTITINIPGNMAYVEEYVDGVLWNEEKQEASTVQTQLYQTITGNTPSAWSLDDHFTLRKQAPELFGNVDVVFDGVNTTYELLPNVNSVQLNNETDAYKGSFIYIVNPVTFETHLFNITSSQNGFITVSETLPQDLYLFTLLSTFNNSAPFSSSFSHVQHNQELCTQVELINLTIPNSVLSGIGRPGDIPYLYVQFNNVPAVGISRIHSNNLQSKKAIFRVPIDHIDQYAPFIHLDGDGMKQSLRLNQRSNIHVKVYLPNGELLNPIPDTSSPECPNPNIQISLLVSVALSQKITTKHRR